MMYRDGMPSGCAILDVYWIHTSHTTAYCLHGYVGCDVLGSTRLDRQQFCNTIMIHICHRILLCVGLLSVASSDVCMWLYSVCCVCTSHTNMCAHACTCTLIRATCRSLICAHTKYCVCTCTHTWVCVMHTHTHTHTHSLESHANYLYVCACAHIICVCAVCTCDACS